MKKVLVITGTRADYGIYFPILKAIQKDQELELQLLVTGMHLSPQYGYTMHHIEKDGFTISAKVDCLLQSSTHANMAKSIGLAIVGMSQALETLSPDCVLVLGDRGEMLAAAIVATHMNIPLFHLHGGEVSGTIDESVRHAISKLAHIHLAATEGSRERLIKLGEDAWRIHVVGAPRIETMLNTPLPDLEHVKIKYGLTAIRKYILFVYHPVTTESANITELKLIIEKLLATQQDIVCVMPNADAGTDAIIRVYQDYQDTPHFYQITNFEQLDYLTMLKHTEVLVGNSSSGIIEAASFAIPVINIGSRQEGRERSANIIDISESAEQLDQALQHIFNNSFKQNLNSTDNVYSQENTSMSIISLFKQFSKSDELIQKMITY
ncbi:UDP-N-acetylglucosamine 2-epimerase [Paenibacillus sp. PK4536]|uniref:UDP-N-acetylglucosamine 2-epimerase n=1 Tax=Paenibacillus sp. PK4536 TaxID=3024576 RepID=UPI00235921C5|nr:UDP-N-acetylglucosamine 2-epimerase [Paenibacillus sp. PK4536]WIM39810.1 UDP-N-acetylglucosamine 2-epimerase [Paenibacillus sp. PK4536]